MVRGYVPRFAVLFTEMVSVELPEPLIEAGLKLELVRGGSPLTLNATDPEKPLIAATETV